MVLERRYPSFADCINMFKNPVKKQKDVKILTTNKEALDILMDFDDWRIERFNQLILEARELGVSPHRYVIQKLCTKILFYEEIEKYGIKGLIERDEWSYRLTVDYIHKLSNDEIRAVNAWDGEKVFMHRTLAKGGNSLEMWHIKKTFEKYKPNRVLAYKMYKFTINFYEFMKENYLHLDGVAYYVGLIDRIEPNAFYLENQLEE